MSKKELRKEALERRSRFSEQERCAKSRVIAQKVMELDAFQKSDKVLLYAPIRNEVETEELYCKAKELQKDIYYPKVIGTEMEFYRVDETTKMELSKYGIWEPVPESTDVYNPEEDDLIFVVMPGAVFDRAGNRIGYGGGYYDKYLHRLGDRVSSKQICKVAVAYECQLVEQGLIKQEIYDIRMDYIITEMEEYSMNILVIDGQGGQLGGQIIKSLKANFENIDITAVGTNATATAAMLKFGASRGATGENPVVVACRKADIIIGPIGIVIADAMLGEITPQMAAAVGRADATRILLPINKCDNLVAGIGDITMTAIIEDAIEKVRACVK